MHIPFSNKPVKRTLFFLLVFLLFLSFILLILFIYSTDLKGNGIIDYSPSIYLLSDGFHSGIVIPNYNNLFKTIYGYEYDSFGFVHYTFAEKSWYLDMDRTFLNAFPTLFIPTEGVIERTFIPKTFSLEDAKDFLNYAFSINVWSFKTSGENLIYTAEKIENDEIGEGEKFYIYDRAGGFKYAFFPAEKKYTLFYNCHQFSLDMLKNCGLDSRGEWYVCFDFLLRVYVQKLLTSQLTLIEK
jgi:cbb3-type cytochrome oxidase subunit 3